MVIDGSPTTRERSQKVRLGAPVATIWKGNRSSSNLVLSLSGSQDRNREAAAMYSRLSCRLFHPVRTSATLGHPQGKGSILEFARPWARRQPCTAYRSNLARQQGQAFLVLNNRFQIRPYSPFRLHQRKPRPQQGHLSTAERWC